MAFSDGSGHPVATLLTRVLPSLDYSTTSNALIETPPPFRTHVFYSTFCGFHYCAIRNNTRSANIRTTAAKQESYLIAEGVKATLGEDNAS